VPHPGEDLKRSGPCGQFDEVAAIQNKTPSPYRLTLSKMGARKQLMPDASKNQGQRRRQITQASGSL
jgi:hypothetical protein